MTISSIEIIFFVLAFFGARLGSILLYQATWQNGKNRIYHPLGAFFTFLCKPWPWLFHVSLLLLISQIDWYTLPNLYFYICMSGSLFSLAAIGRIGAFDLRCLFMIDRFIVFVLAIGLWFSPVFLYPLLIACCCLQYTVSGSSWSPGYSNLLGFEFMRNTLCQCFSSIVVLSGVKFLESHGLIIGDRLLSTEILILAIVLSGQAASYVPQAISKCALGERWYSWALKNRLECLVVNAYLRGWCAGFIKEKWVLCLANWISKFRVLFCSMVLLIEMSWLLILVNPSLTTVILVSTIAFHSLVWLLTGLISYHYITSHLLVLFLLPVLVTEHSFHEVLLIAGVCCILLSSIWVLVLRRKIYIEFKSGVNESRYVKLIDAADHLMAWWDGPSMRMYTYSVKTSSDKQFNFPVTKFSPYDTFLTDIHTHIMILGKKWEFDQYMSEDRKYANTGVWGLVISLEERDKLYHEMDEMPIHISNQISTQRSINELVNSEVIQKSQSHFVKFFQGLNFYQSKWWFRILFLFPHFPGEDWVPDISPLAIDKLPNYSGDEPIIELTIKCVKTFYSKNSIKLISDLNITKIKISQL